MKKYGKIAALIAGVALVVGFASCKADTETEYVDRIIEKEIKVKASYAASPIFTATSDEGKVNVTISCPTEGAAIYYTTDGSVPTAESTQYTTALTFTEDATLNAIAIKTGLENSPVSYAKVSITEKTVEIPTDKTSHDAVVVYTWLQDTSGIGYKKYQSLSSGGNVTAAAGTKFADLAASLDYDGFTAKGFVESLQADGTYVVNVYYDRNLVTITVTVGETTLTFKGLYGSDIDVSGVVSATPAGYFIAASDIPATYPAEDNSYGCTLAQPAVAESDGFIKVPKGSFKRASDSGATEYTITISKDLYVCDHEVTQGEWEKYMTYYGEVYPDDYRYYRPNTYDGKGENFPVYNVNWYEAVIYCNLLSIANNLTPAYYITIGEGEGSKKTNPEDWLNTETFASNIKKTDDGKFYYDGTSSNSKLDYKGEGDTDGGIQLDKNANGYRLPTEAEWEYAALGSYKDNENWNGYGDKSNTSGYVFAGYDGTNADNIGKYAWYYSNSSSKTHEVKGKLPNSYGLYDMSGNVWEWCSDWYDDYSSSDENDPTGSASGSDRVRRGGSKDGYSWDSYASYCVVSCRSSSSPNSRYSNIGFRLVRNAE